ncbi:MAG: hypothetical protein IPP48_03445 [Chitinophagaceae bacterium]|nr:hypothetical protein [Chitinophagaceae bacterium]
MLVTKVNQNMLDLTVQHTGDLANLFALAKLNGISINHIPDAGNMLLPVEITEKKTVRFFEQINYDVVTIEPSFTTPIPLTGIGSMQVGTTFIVS